MDRGNAWRISRPESRSAEKRRGDMTIIGYCAMQYVFICAQTLFAMASAPGWVG